MKKMKFEFLKKSGKLLLLAITVMSVSLSSCKKDDNDDDDDDNTNKIIKIVEGNIVGDVTWSADTIYKLRGFVRVGVDDGTGNNGQQFGTLRIQAGTLIIGDRATKGTLVVQRGSKLYAEGEQNKPIIMTSERGPGLKEPGDWGGLVICGRASNNRSGGVFELEGNYGGYNGGGTSPIEDDNSGVIKYLRIEYAGVPINPNQEVNSLTMGSVGNGTVIEYVMCSYGLDDAFEWFGGTVNGKYLIAYRSLDDDWDVDFGYSGNVQFGLSIKDRSLADQSGSNGFEVDNDGSGTNASPFTSGTFSNITCIGPKANRETAINTDYQNAGHLRRNNKIKIHNSFFTGYPAGFFIQGSNTQTNAANGELVLKNNILAAVENWGGNGFGGAGTMYVNTTVGIDTVNGVPTGKQHPNPPRGVDFPDTASIGGQSQKAWFLANGNQILNKWQDAGIDPSMFELGTPNVLPSSGSPLLSGSSFSAMPNDFQQVPFRGAFGTTDWTTGWAEWQPSTKQYYLP